MNITEEKNRLKNEIDKVDNPYILDRISEILAENGSSSLMTDEQYAIVMERREEYLKNPSSAISFEEFDTEIKKKYGF
ncbi:hypothetical protein FMM05_10040 [Flavobacterium zepuense]|uniref:Uncharacterized protein n=1 Tax=Flavobacterium zepuense TaxID=2593302 RepID=A0A552V2W7_9FLAO|nr:hypothetical protein [Flavobacterium zepuense]TRW24830.1 hypothetical protein FMM05_10040 [Flavobacterium zepuense]